MNTVEEDLWSYLCNGMRPDPSLTISEWADQYRILPQSTSAEHGRWRTDRFPYLRDIMDALSPSSRWRKVVLMKGAQVGGSEVGFNFIGYGIAETPAPTMILMPTLDMAKLHSKTRIDPMIEATPVLSGRVSEAKSRDGSNAALFKSFPGGLLVLAGANSASRLKSMPIRYLMLDEVDEYPPNVEDQGGAVELAEARTRTFRRAKIYECSTPTVSGTSRIEADYEQTQRMRCYLPCPHCEGFQVLKWEQIRFDKSNPLDAYYVCEHCGAAIQNHDKAWMLPRYEWRPDVPDYKGDAIGFHLPSFYAPPGWITWGEIAKAWLDAGKDEQKLKVVKNTMFGESWKPIGEVPDWERLFNRREKYDRNTIPGGGLVLTCGADVQKDYIQVEVVAWGRGKESWSVDTRVFPGDTADPDGPAWQMLAEFLDMTFAHESGMSLTIKCLAVDSSDQTQTVYNWCRRYPVNRVIPIKGMSSLAVMLGAPKAVDVYVSGRRSKKAIKLWGVGVDIAKVELYGWLRMPTPEPAGTPAPGYCHFPGGAESLQGGYEEEFFRQLTGEQLQQRTLRNKQITYEWVKIRDRNEALDCRVYARAASAMLQIDKFEPHHWEQIERAIWGDRAPKTPATAIPGATTIPTSTAPSYARPAKKQRRVRSEGVKL